MSIHTRCPICHTIFRIEARDVSASLGQAKCGVCGMVFDAIAQHTPDPATTSSEPATNAVEDINLDLMMLEPPFFLDQTPSVKPSKTGRTLPESPDTSVSLPATDPSWEASTEPIVGSDDVTTDLSEQDLSSSEDEPLLDSSLTGLSVSFKPVAKQHIWRYSAINVVLVFTLMAQYTLSRPNDFISQSTLFYHALESSQSWFYPIVLPPDNLSALKISDSELRADPHNSQYLHLMLSITNLALTPVAYPNISITLTDENGEAVSRKNLSPEDYLSKTKQPNVRYGLPAQQPTPINLLLNVSARNTSNYTVNLYYPQHP